MNEKEAEALASIKEAMQGHSWRLESVLTFSGTAVQVYAKKANGRYAKVGPIIFPNKGEDISHVLTLLGNLAMEKKS